MDFLDLEKKLDEYHVTVKDVMRMIANANGFEDFIFLKESNAGSNEFSVTIFWHKRGSRDRVLRVKDDLSSSLSEHIKIFFKRQKEFSSNDFIFKSFLLLFLAEIAKGNDIVAINVDYPSPTPKLNVILEKYKTLEQILIDNDLRSIT